MEVFLTNLNIHASSLFNRNNFDVGKGLGNSNALCKLRNVVSEADGNPSLSSSLLHLLYLSTLPFPFYIRELKKFGPMLLVAGSIACAGQLVASGELTVYA